MGANAQTTVPTFTAGQVLTADQQNQSARTGVPVFADSSARDAAFGGAGEKTLAEGQLAYLEDSNVVQYYDGAAWATVGPSALTTSTATVATSQTSASTTYTDLATVGPSVTLTTGTSVLVLVSAFMDNNFATIYTDFAISGATTRSATDTTCLLDVFSGAGAKRLRATVANLVTVTAGSNTFTMKYRVAGSTGAWQDRTIGVIAL